MATPEIHALKRKLREEREQARRALWDNKLPVSVWRDGEIEKARADYAEAIRPFAEHRDQRIRQVRDIARAAIAQLEAEYANIVEPLEQAVSDWYRRQHEGGQS